MKFHIFLASRKPLVSLIFAPNLLEGALLTGSWKAGKAIKLGGTIWSQGNLKSKEPSIDVVRAWPRFAILRWWKRNNFCTDFLFCEERLSEDDFSNTEAYMKAFINGESGRSWKQFISNFDVFIHDSLPCHPIHMYQFHVSYIFSRTPLPGFRDDLFVFANWPTCLLDTFKI